MRIKNYEVKQLKAEDPHFEELAGQARSICDQLLGEGLYSEERIREICQKKSHYFYIIRSGTQGAGVFYCYADLAGNVSFAKELGFPFLQEDTRIGVGQSIALEPEARHKGVSDWMLNYGTGLLFDKERVKAILVPAWVKGRKIPAGRHLESCGYRLARIVKHPWAGYKDLKCPVCGKCPCVCDGAIYVKKEMEHE